jgi:hypothetical protein
VSRVTSNFIGWIWAPRQDSHSTETKSRNIMTPNYESENTQYMLVKDTNIEEEYYPDIPSTTTVMDEYISYFTATMILYLRNLT